MADAPRDHYPVDLHAVVTRVQGQGPLWTYVGDDLNANLVVWPAGAGVNEHVNHEVEVLILVVEGSGLVTVAGQEHAVHPGEVFVIPKGMPRTILSQAPRFAYLSVHRRRSGMWPAPHVS